MEDWKTRDMIGKQDGKNCKKWKTSSRPEESALLQKLDIDITGTLDAIQDMLL